MSFADKIELESDIVEINNIEMLEEPEKVQTLRL